MWPTSRSLFHIHCPSGATMAAQALANTKTHSTSHAKRNKEDVDGEANGIPRLPPARFFEVGK